MTSSGVAYIGLYVTRSMMFYRYQFHAVLCGNFSRRGIQDWLNANTESAWQSKGRENKLTKTYTRKEFKTLLHEAGFANIRIRQTPLQLRDVPIVGRVLFRFGLTLLPERRIGAFGRILMATFKKS